MAEKRSDDEKAAGNTLCICKVFEDVWAFFCPSKPCVSLSTEKTKKLEISMQFKKYVKLRKYVNGVPTDEYKKGNLIAVV